MPETAFQDQLHDNFCFGCGADNPDGLRIKSYWQDGVARCVYQPLSHHAAGPRHILNGGIIATLLDCHAICTAVADAYRREQRAIGSPPDLWYATGSLAVRYLRPAPLAEPVTLWAEVTAADERRSLVACRLESAGKVRAEAEVTAVRVPPSWRHGNDGTA